MSSTAISNLACEPAHFMGGRENIAGKKGGGSTVAHKGHHCIRMLYLTFRVFYLQFACSICSSHVLFSIPRAPFAARVFHFLFACSFVLAFSFAARALDRVIRALCFFSRVFVHVTLSQLTCMACWKQHGGSRGRGRC